MNLAIVLSPLRGLSLALYLGFFPTLKAVWYKPALLLSSTALSHTFMNFVWGQLGNDIDEGTSGMKRDLLKDAKGVVLDLGAGYGHTARYLQRGLGNGLDNVTTYIAVEPNTAMHPHIKQIANDAGFNEQQGSLIILSCSAGDIETIISAMGGRHKADTIVSILTMCSVSKPKETLEALVDNVLCPRGVFLYHEHVQNPRPLPHLMQRIWTPIWKLGFDGCCLDRPTNIYVEQMGEGVWAEGGYHTTDDEPGAADHIFRHATGRYVKATN